MQEKSYRHVYLYSFSYFFFACDASPYFGEWSWQKYGKSSHGLKVRAPAKQVTWLINRRLLDFYRKVDRKVHITSEKLEILQGKNSSPLTKGCTEWVCVFICQWLIKMNTWTLTNFTILLLSNLKLTIKNEFEFSK